MSTMLSAHHGGFAAMANETPTAEEIAAQEAEAVAEAARVAEEAEIQRLGEGGINALRAEREARATAEREATEVKAKVAEFERQSMTEVDRVKSERDEALKDRDVKANENARLNAVIEHGLSKADAATLGPWSEDFAERAAALAERLKSTAQEVKPGFPPARNAGQTGGVKTSSVSAGRDLYHETHGKKTASTS